MEESSPIVNDKPVASLSLSLSPSPSTPSNEPSSSSPSSSAAAKKSPASVAAVKKPARSVALNQFHLSAIRGCYPHLNGATDEQVIKFSAVVAQIDKLTGSTEPVYRLLHALPARKIVELVDVDHRVLKFNFHTEDHLLLWIKTWNGRPTFSSRSWKQFLCDQEREETRISANRHINNLEKIQKNPKMICVIIHTDTTIYLSSGITI